MNVFLTTDNGNSASDSRIPAHTVHNRLVKVRRVNNSPACIRRQRRRYKGG